jgi:ubiquinone/menaquinone biosynthesis C-methylase UbiE
MALFRRRSDPHALLVAMTGVQMGERLLQIGSADRAMLGALASKVGLSGRAAVVVFTDDEQARAQASAARAGALVDVDRSRDGTIAFEEHGFDLLVIDNTGDLITTMTPERRVRTLQEAHRVLRPGGRIIVVEAAERGGLGALFSRRASNEQFRNLGGATTALEAEGFRSVRVLAEREGRRFIEGLRARGTASADRP